MINIKKYALQYANSITKELCEITGIPYQTRPKNNVDTIGNSLIKSCVLTIGDEVIDCYVDE